MPRRSAAIDPSREKAADKVAVKAGFVAQPLVAVTVPMPDAAPTARAQSLLAAAEKREVATAADYTVASSELIAIKAKWTEIENTRVTLKAPLLQAIKQLDGFFKGPLDFLARAERMLKTKLGEYSDRQEALRLEEQHRADEAARKVREKLEEQARKAEAAGKVEKAQHFEQRAAAVVAPVIQRAAPVVPGIGERDVYEYEVTDESKLPREYMSIDHSKIRKVVNALKLHANIPGVTVRRKTGIAAGSG